MEGVAEATVLGKSILVPSVQELVKQNKLDEVLDRYIQPDHVHPILSNDHRADFVDLQLPIIDMIALLWGDPMELQKLHSACQNWGFFQVINHGVSSSLVENLKLETREFLNLPMEEKQKYWQKPTEIEGFGQAFVMSEEQKLDWCDMFFLTTFPKHERRPDLFPLLPLPFRDTLDKYSAEMRRLARKILDCVAEALNIDNEILRNIFGEGHQMMRLNYYPPCPQPEKTIGLTPHSDAVALTILLQVDDVNGLEIMKDDRWILINPQPNAFVVNIGDILEILSNGIYRSILHRVVVNANKERLSVGTFYSPSLKKEIGPIPELITSKAPARFAKTNMVDYWKEFFARRLDGKSYLNAFKIEQN